MRLARELDYTPAAAARSLKTQRTHVIGVFLETGEGHPDLQHPFFHEVLVGLKNSIGAGGYDLLLFASEHPGNGYGSHSYLKRARHHDVEGVVADGHRPRGPEVRRLVRSETADGRRRRRARGPGHDLRDVRQRRRRRQSRAPPALPGAPPHRDDHRPARDDARAPTACAATAQAMQATGLAYRDEYVAYGDFYVESGRRAMADLLVTRRAADSGLRRLGHDGPRSDPGRRRRRPATCPRDLSVVGFDDIQLADHMNPPLTTLRQDKAGLGVAAGTALCA